jgi:crossover junction endodeoxyribonuclease RuvC
MRIIGIDPGLRELGWAILDINGKKIKLRDFGVIQSQYNGELVERIWEIGKKMEMVFKKWKPDIAGIESVFVWKDPSASLKLGIIVGTCIEIARRKKVEVQIISPLYIKSKITGGDQMADKEKVKKSVIRKLKKFEGKMDGKLAQDIPHHITDAISIAISANLKRSEEKNENRKKIKIKLQTDKKLRTKLKSIRI